MARTSATRCASSLIPRLIEFDGHRHGVLLVSLKVQCCCVAELCCEHEALTGTVPTTERAVLASLFVVTRHFNHAACGRHVKCFAQVHLVDESAHVGSLAGHRATSPSHSRSSVLVGKHAGEALDFLTHSHLEQHLLRSIDAHPSATLALHISVLVVLGDGHHGEFIGHSGILAHNARLEQLGKRHRIRNATIEVVDSGTQQGELNVVHTVGHRDVVGVERLVSHIDVSLGNTSPVHKVGRVSHVQDARCHAIDNLITGEREHVASLAAKTDGRGDEFAVDRRIGTGVSPTLVVLGSASARTQNHIVVVAPFGGKVVLEVLEELGIAKAHSIDADVEVASVGQNRHGSGLLSVVLIDARRSHGDGDFQHIVGRNHIGGSDTIHSEAFGSENVRNHEVAATNVGQFHGEGLLALEHTHFLHASQSGRAILLAEFAHGHLGGDGDGAGAHAGATSGLLHHEGHRLAGLRLGEHVVETQRLIAFAIGGSECHTAGRTNSMLQVVASEHLDSIVLGSNCQRTLVVQVGGELDVCHALVGDHGLGHISECGDVHVGSVNLLVGSKEGYRATMHEDGHASLFALGQAEGAITPLVSIQRGLPTDGQRVVGDGESTIGTHLIGLDASRVIR